MTAVCEGNTTWIILYPSQHLIDDQLPQRSIADVELLHPSVLLVHFIVYVYLYDRVRDFIFYRNA